MRRDFGNHPARQALAGQDYYDRLLSACRSVFDIFVTVCLPAWLTGREKKRVTYCLLLSLLSKSLISSLLGVGVGLGDGVGRGGGWGVGLLSKCNIFISVSVFVVCLPVC